MGMCKKCGMISGAVLLIVGLLYLLQDLGTIAWWTLNWYTVAFLLAGLFGLACKGCADCQSCCKPDMKLKK